MPSAKNLFITAIDTDAGKSVATGALARWLRERGVRVITQKMAQTGGAGLDLAVHRRIMGCEPFPEDRDGLTCPYAFAYPASPQLAAQMEGRRVDMETIHAAQRELARRYDAVLTEGVGGLLTPLADDLTVADYLTRHPQPAVLVTHGKLGSINATLLTLEACKSRRIALTGVLFNHGIPADPRISADALAVIRRALAGNYPDAALVEMPFWEENAPGPDFSPLFRGTRHE